MFLNRDVLVSGRPLPFVFACQVQRPCFPLLVLMCRKPIPSSLELTDRDVTPLSLELTVWKSCQIHCDCYSVKPHYLY